MDRTLLVIGGSSDMGMALVRAIHAGYDAVIVHYRRCNAALDALQAELGGRLIGVQADLASEEQTLAMIEAVRGYTAVPEHIVHFPACQFRNQNFHKLPWADLQRQWDVSVRSFVLVAQAFLPQMVQRRRGKLVAMLSAAVNGTPPKYCADYIAVKYAMLGLVKALAAEYAHKGITVNGVSPQMVDTKYLEQLHGYLLVQDAKQSPLGRTLTPQDVVPAIAFLLSEKADCINGQNLSITCGR